MSYEPREGIVLFPNERTNERQPVMRGTLTVTNVLRPGEYEISLWGKTSKKGNKYWSGEFKEKQDRPREQKPTVEAEPFNDDIPF